jgi:hypothetical protein
LGLLSERELVYFYDLGHIEFIRLIFNLSIELLCYFVNVGVVLWLRYVVFYPILKSRIYLKKSVSFYVLRFYIIWKELLTF